MIMSYGIMRIEKRKASALHGIEKENNRDGEMPRFFKNSPNIDWDLTSQNEFLVKSNDWLQTIKEDISSKGIKKVRSDATLAIDGLYTVSPEWASTHSRAELEKYFSECMKFHNRNYGQIFNAVIHFDEATPHLHVCSIPYSLKPNGEWSLSAKALLGGPQKIHKKQDMFYEEVSRQFGLERCKPQDKENKRVHLDTLDYSIKCEQDRLAALNKHIQELENSDDLIGNILSLEGRIAELEEDNKKIYDYAEKQEDRFYAVWEALQNVLDRLGLERVYQLIKNEFDALTGAKKEKIRPSREEDEISL